MDRTLDDKEGQGKGTLKRSMRAAKTHLAESMRSALGLRSVGHFWTMGLI